MPYDNSTKTRKYPMSGGNSGKSYGGSAKKAAMHNTFGVIKGSMGYPNVMTPSGPKSAGKNNNPNYGSAGGYD